MNVRKKTPVLGIDLGTTTSLACILEDEGGGEERYTMIQTDSARGLDILPSLFCMTDDGPLVGDLAKEMLRDERYRDHVIRGVKRYMAYEGYTFDSANHTITPTEISGMLLRTLRESAERQLGLRERQITEAVVTVPANFGHIERRKTVEAAEQYAGISRVHLLDEPIAAALGLGLHRQRKSELVMVLDLGGGTLDVTLLLVGGQVGFGGFYEIGRSGHARLGGVNWDNEIARIAVWKQDEKRPQHFRRAEDFFDLQNVDLYERCELAKYDLCSDHFKLNEVPVSYFDRQVQKQVDSSITQNEFQAATAYLAKSCAAVCDQLRKQVSQNDLNKLRHHGSRLFGLLPKSHKPLSWTEVDKVYMVGGGSRIPNVQRAIYELTGI